MFVSWVSLSDENREMVVVTLRSEDEAPSRAARGEAVLKDEDENLGP
jgi:hypothetical protein